MLLDQRVKEAKRYKDILPVWRNARCLDTKSLPLTANLFREWRHKSCSTAFYAFNAQVRNCLIHTDWFPLLAIVATDDLAGQDWLSRGIFCYLFGAPVFSPAGLHMTAAEHLPETPRVYFGHTQLDGYLAANYVELELT